MKTKMWPFDDDGLKGGGCTTCGKGCKVFFQRPFTYFCFGLPMIAPSICLVLLSDAEDGLTVSLVIGSILLIAGTVSVSIGICLGVRSCRKSLNHTKGEQKQATGVGEPSASVNPLSPRTSQSPSSRRSSSSSTKTTSNIHISTFDKSKLVSVKRKGMRRKGKRGVKFPTEPLPPLTEEETFVKALSRGNTHLNLKSEALPANEHNKKHNHRPIGANNDIEELKDYLSNIGLGAVPPEKLSMSLDEKDMYRQSPPVHTKDMPPHSSRDIPSRVKSPRPDYPTVVTASHERTGIRLP